MYGGSEFRYGSDAGVSRIPSPYSCLDLGPEYVGVQSDIKERTLDVGLGESEDGAHYHGIKHILWIRASS